MFCRGVCRSRDRSRNDVFREVFSQDRQRRCFCYSQRRSASLTGNLLRQRNRSRSVSPSRELVSWSERDARNERRVLPRKCPRALIGARKCDQCSVSSASSSLRVV